MKTLGALFAFAFLVGSAEASSISLSGLDSKGKEGQDFSAWSRVQGRNGSDDGGAFLKDTLSADYGVDIRFRYSMGDEKDGFSFLVLDAKRSAESGRQESVLGVEFTRGFGEPGRDAISLRGPGNGTEKEFTEFGFANYGLIATTGDFEAASMRVDEGWKKLLREKSGASQDTEVIVDTTQLRERRLPVTVLMAGEDGEPVVVAKYDAYKEVSEYYGGAENIPSAMNIGFSGSTGGPTNFATASFSMAPTGAETPEPSTLMLAIGGALVALGAGLRRKR